MATIHHATLARATKLGVRLIEVLDMFQLVRIEDGALSTSTFQTAKAAVQAMADGAVEFEAPGKRNRSGVMVITYHKLYTLNGGGNGDQMDQTLRATLVSESGTDLELLQATAEANGVWNPDWASLNPGMQRMNLANRLRAKLRNDANAEVEIGGQAGRFDVEFKPRAKKARKAK